MDAAVFGEFAQGDFDRNGSLDVAVQDRWRVALCQSPDAFSTARFLPLDASEVVHDLASLPDDLGTHRSDLLTVGSQGLRRHTWSGGDWSSSAPSPNAGPTATWIDAPHVTVACTNAPGVFDAVGISATGSLLVSTPDGSGGFTAPVEYGTLGTPYDLLPIDWDGDATDEIALLMPWGFAVVDGATIVAALPAQGTYIGAVLDADDSTERLVLTTRVGTTDWIAVWDSAGFEGPTPIGDVGAVALGAGDIAGDERLDVVLQGTSSPNYLVLENRSATGPTFELASSYQKLFGDPMRDPALSESGLAVGDFDGDGDGDVVVGAQGGGVLSSVRSRVVFSPGFKSSGSRNEIALAPRFGTSSFDPDDWVLSMTIELPATPLSSAEEMRLHISAWHRPDPDLATESTLVREVTFPIFAPPLGMPEYAISIPAAGFDTADGSDVFSVVARQIVVRNGVIEEQGPAIVLFWTSLTQGSELLPSIPGASVLQAVVPVIPAKQGVPVGGIVGGGGRGTGNPPSGNAPPVGN